MVDIDHTNLLTAGTICLFETANGLRRPHFSRLRKTAVSLW